MRIILKPEEDSPIQVFRGNLHVRDNLDVTIVLYDDLTATEGELHLGDIIGFLNNFLQCIRVNNGVEGLQMYRVDSTLLGNLPDNHVNHGTTVLEVHHLGDSQLSPVNPVDAPTR